MPKAERRKRNTLKKELLLLSCICLCVSGAFYFALSKLISNLMDQHFNDKSHMQVLEKRNIKRLQDYITKNNLSIHQINQIDHWIDEHEYVFVKLYSNNKLIYDSAYEIISDEAPLPETPVDFSGVTYYTLYFTDAEAKAIIVCMDDYIYYNYVNYLLLILAFVLFFALFSFGLHKKIQYLITLKRELDILTEKDLDHPISILGNDEISCVGQSIESLRVSMIDKIAKEKAAYESNRELLTSLSHDIRTPLTSLIAYLEIDKRKGIQGNDEYVNASLKKAYHLKDLTDQLFQHFLLYTRKYEASKELVNGNELIVQMIEENLYDLELRGVKILREVQDITCTLYVTIDLIQRLFDNIFSNITKYADLTKEITVGYSIFNKNLKIYFKNFIQQNKVINHSSQIGMKNCQEIIKIHKGSLEVKELLNIFSVTIYLPIVEMPEEALCEMRSG